MIARLVEVECGAKIAFRMLTRDDAANYLIEHRETHPVLSRDGGQRTNPTSRNVARELCKAPPRSCIDVFEQKVWSISRAGAIQHPIESELASI